MLVMFTLMIQPLSTFFTLTFQSPYAGFPSFELWNKFFDYEKIKSRTKRDEIIKWISLALPVAAIIISLISKSHASN